MDIGKFKQISEQYSSRLSASLFVILSLSITVLIQALYIGNRADIVIERPMFQDDKELKYVRDKVTENVALTWAYNAVMIFGNVTPENYKFVRASAYSMLGSDISERLKIAHDKLVQKMAEQKILISFTPDSALFNPVNGEVRIRGIREIKSVANDADGIKPTKSKYEYRVIIRLLGFRPYVDEWEEGIVE